MNILLGYFVFVSCFFLVGTIVLLTIEEVIVISFKKIKEFFYPTPKLSEQEANKIYKEAADFVHSKHRPWMYDDTFAEYLGLVHEMSEKRWKELYSKH